MATYLVTIKSINDKIDKLFSILDIDDIEGLTSIAIDDDLPSDKVAIYRNNDKFEEIIGALNIKLYFDNKPDKKKLKRQLKNQDYDIAISDSDIIIEKLENRNWVTFSEETRDPIKAGRFFIYSSFHKNKVPPNLISVEIEAAEAFGSGHHGSTMGCLSMLDNILKSHKPKNAIDIGCGSGILAIAIAKYLKTNIYASDIDPISVSTTKANSTLNSVSHYINCFESDGISQMIIKKAPYDLIIANILFPVLKEIAKDVAKISKKDTNLILSGLLTNQAKKIINHYRNYGFKVHSKAEVEEWSTILLIKQ